jgi:hypothetical protein
MKLERVALALLLGCAGGAALGTAIAGEHAPFAETGGYSVLP